MEVSCHNQTMLIVENDTNILGNLREVFVTKGYRVLTVETGAAAREVVSHEKVAIILLDLMLPDVDGLVLCADLKSKTDAAIIIVSASNQPRDRILGLKLGADDFVGKPFDIYELEARVEAVLRRAKASKQSAVPNQNSLSHVRPAIQLRDLILNTDLRRVTVNGQELQLTQTEYRLLVALTSMPDQAISREELARQVWRYSDAAVGRAIDAHVRRLRAKLSQKEGNIPEIEFIRGSGYKIVS